MNLQNLEKYVYIYTLYFNIIDQIASLANLFDFIVIAIVHSKFVLLKMFSKLDISFFMFIVFIYWVKITNDNNKW